MKVRFDFVTNSSSSSFVICRIDNKALANLYLRCGLSWKLEGKDLSVVRDKFTDEQTDMRGPDGGSIADWLQFAINLDYCCKDEPAYQTLVELLKQNKDEVDHGTTRADFATVVSVTDGEGTYFSSEERKSGKITYTGFGEADWDYEKEGEYIDDFVVGNTDEIRRKSKELCGTTVEDDPWVEKKDVSGIFDSAEGFTFDDQVVCLTGDFDYGPKAKVTSYIEDHGGTVASSVTRKVTVLLVGNKGSDAWSHGNYGTKIEKAVERREMRDDIVIIRESDIEFE